MSNNIEVFEYNDPNARFGFTPNSILNLKEMNNKKQSSIEQVFSHIKASRNDIQYWNDSMLVDWLLEQEDRLKAMHKDEVESAWRNGLIKGMDSPLPEKYYNESSQYYYNETFGGNNE